MASPERQNVDIPIDRTAALVDVDRQLELNDNNENTIERFFRRDELLEERDALLAEMEATPPVQE